MFYKIDVLEKSAKFTRNCLYQTLLTLAQMFSCEYFEIFRNTFFTSHLLTTASDFNPIFLLSKDVFVSEQINICLIFRAILGISKFMGPGPLGPHTFSTYNKCYWGKNYFHKMLQGSEYNRMLNMSVFCLDIRVLNMPLVLNIPGF